MKKKHKTLIVYPHGLGDCIAATPAFRKYAHVMKDHEIHISVCKPDAKVYAGQSPTPCADLLENLPYIDKVWPIHSHLWAREQSNWHVMEREVASLAKEVGFHKMFFIKHKRISPPVNFLIHKMFRTAAELGIELLPNELATDVLIDSDSWNVAQRFFTYHKLNPEKDTILFIHGKTNVKNKNLTLADIKEIMSDFLHRFKFDKIIECDSHYFDNSVDHLTTSTPIKHNMAIMLYCSHAILVDSVMMHARGAYSLPMVAGFTAKNPVFQAVPIHYEDFGIYTREYNLYADYEAARVSLKKWRDER